MTDEPRSEMPPLEALCKGYFNQDWDLWGPDAAAVLDEYGLKNPLEDLVGAREAATDLLDRGLSDEELKAELDALGLEYAPDYEGRTHRQWLELVASRLTTWIERRE